MNHQFVPVNSQCMPSRTELSCGESLSVDGYLGGYQAGVFGNNNSSMNSGGPAGNFCVLHCVELGCGDPLFTGGSNQGMGNP